MTRILIALDDSAGAVHAAREAVRLFPDERTEFLVLNVGHGLDAPLWMAQGGVTTPAVPYGMVMPWVPTSDLQAPAMAQADAQLGATTEADPDEIEERARLLGVPEPHALTDVGDPAEAICAAADEHDVDVIVVGAHDRGFLSRLIDPSVSAGVVRSTSRPVLVVSAPAD